MHDQVYCWGDNSLGVLGSAPSAESPFAAAIPGLPPVAGVAFSGSHACALTLGGDVYCWGANTSKQAGPTSAPDGTCPAYPDRPELRSVPCQPQPTRIAGISHAIDVAATAQQSCAVLADGTVHCWGNSGDLGVWLALQRGATSISLSQASACLTKEDGSFDCSFQLPDYIRSMRVERVALAQRDLDFSMSGGLLCGLGAGGSVICAGDNSSGGLGIGNLDPSTALEAAIPSGVTQVAVGEYSSCALSEDGRVRCWGDATIGALGSPMFASPSCGSGTCESTPREVEGLPKAVGIDAFGFSVCALGEDDSVWCWGDLWPWAPTRIAGPWEMNGAACAPSLDRARAWRNKFNGPIDGCVSNEDCAILPLSLSCDATCAVVSVSRSRLASLKSEQAALDADVCASALALGCAEPSVTCPSANELRAICLSGECLPDDPTRTGCTDACLCEAKRLIPVDGPKCDGFDLHAWQTATCGTCDRSGIYVVIENQGSAPFSGSVVMDFPNTPHAPAPKTLNLMIPALGRAEPVYVESPAQVQGTVRVTTNGDCNPSDDTWGGISFPQPAPLCN